VHLVHFDEAARGLEGVAQKVFARGDQVREDGLGDEVEVPCYNGKGDEDTLVGLVSWKSARRVKDGVCTIVIHKWIDLLCKSQCEKVPSGLIMLGYFFVAMRFLSSSDTGAP
jgi:hypothetical protein